MRCVFLLATILTIATSGLRAQPPRPDDSDAKRAEAYLYLKITDQMIAKFGHFPPKEGKETEIWAKVLATDPTALGSVSLEKNGQELRLLVSNSASSPERLISIWLPVLRTLVKKYDLKGSGVRFLGVIPAYGKLQPKKKYALAVLLEKGYAYVWDETTNKVIDVPW